MGEFPGGGMGLGVGGWLYGVCSICLTASWEMSVKLVLGTVSNLHIRGPRGAWSR